MKNMLKLLTVLLLAGGLIGGCVTAPRGAGASTAAAKAGKLTAKYQNAIVNISGTLKVSMTIRNMGMSQAEETPVEATGTVVDPSGLVICGTLMLDPVGSIIRSPLRIQQGDQTIEIDMKPNLENLRLLLADKTEVPMQIIARDDDLGLAVLAPVKQAGAKPPVFTAINLVQEESPQLYASYFVFGRAGEIFQRAILMGRGMPVNTFTKPRPCHTFLTPMMPVGMPVFSAEGRLVGIGGLLFRKPDLEHPETMEKNHPLPCLYAVSDVRELVARAQKAGAKPAVVGQPAAPTAATLGEPTPEQARALIAAKQGAIVTLRGTVKFTDGANPRVQEERIECVATFVNAEGFAVCGSSGRAVNRKYQEQRLNFVLNDGSEVPARIVVQDDDLALTVLMPAPADGAAMPKLPFMPLQANVRAGLFDDVLTISRLDQRQHFTPTADTGKITGLVTQPRPFYLIDGNIGGRNALGAPTFLADGRLLGLLAMTPQKRQQRPRAAGALQSELNVQQELVRVVPAAAVADLVEQARKAAAKK